MVRPSLPYRWCPPRRAAAAAAAGARHTHDRHWDI